MPFNRVIIVKYTTIPTATIIPHSIHVPFGSKVRSPYIVAELAIAFNTKLAPRISPIPLQ
jgi:hypothetical protein